MKNNTEQTTAKTLLGLSISGIVFSSLAFIFFWVMLHLNIRMVSIVYNKYPIQEITSLLIGIGVCAFLFAIFGITLIVIAIITIVYAIKLSKTNNHPAIVAGWICVLVGLILGIVLIPLIIVGFALLIWKSTSKVKKNTDSDSLRYNNHQDSERISSSDWSQSDDGVSTHWND